MIALVRIKGTTRQRELSDKFSHFRQKIVYVVDAAAHMHVPTAAHVLAAAVLADIFIDLIRVADVLVDLIYR